MENADKRPPRMFFVNLHTTEAVDVQFNPTMFDRETSVSWQHHQVIGQSYRPVDYLGTENAKLSLELYFRAETAVEYEAATDAVNFIESLQYPPEDADSIGGRRPPRVLVVWPGSMTFTCVFTSVHIKHNLFDSKGRTRQWSVKIEVEEARKSRLSQEAVRRSGPIRTADGED